jgi:NAD-dependent DNA ligase
MNAPLKLDTLATFLGPIPDEERERRAKLMAYRNAAAGMIAQTQSDTARWLAFVASDWINPFLFDRAIPVEFLDRLTMLVSRLLKTAITAEEIEALLQEAERNDD